MTTLIENKKGPNESVLNLQYKSHPGDHQDGVVNPMFPDYKIYRDGTVIYNDTKEKVKGTKDKLNYIRYPLIDVMGKKYLVQAHRLMLMTYRPIRYSALYHVNHLDRNPSNNRLDNLEWVTNSQNNQYGRKTQYQEHMDWNRPVGVVIHNVFTDETKEYTRIDECASFLGLQRDDVIRRLNKHPINKIWPDGWRFKRRQDNRDWPEITPEDIKNISSGKARPITFRWMKTNEIIETEHISELSKKVDIPVVTLWEQLNRNSEGDAKAYMRNTKDGLTSLYQLKYKYDEREWKKYPTLWHAVADAKDTLKPVLVITADGQEHIYATGREVAKQYQLLTTTLNYRLQRHSNNPFPDGNIYRYYLDWYNENK